ncbi:copper transporter [Inediibacterium massiliense]|uniref:copper transporter n=1 Tax=Inediibacterium massiliense TaxID=1658111 RepID=UPI0006B60BD7|nr:copper transporter [Inediibacterium massiliense]
MVINLKYYVITIVAIFLALGIGLFIGIMLDGQDLIVQQQQQMVSQLEKKFDEFKVKQDALQEKIDILNKNKENNEKFLNNIYPVIVKDQLQGLNVVIVETTEHYDYSTLTDAFYKAGANNVTNVLINDSFMLGETKDSSNLIKEFNLTTDSDESLQVQLTKRLCSAVTLGNDMEFINKLKEKKMIDYTGEIIPHPGYVVIGGGSVDEQRNVLKDIDTPMINFLKSSDIPTIAVERLDVAYSNIAEYKKLRISTVDNVDTLIGKISMLMVVGGQEGHFGEKETAEGFIPQGFKTKE